MRFKKEKDEEPGINMVPLIDVLFLILVFLLLTSTFDIATGIRIQLPKVMNQIVGQERVNINLLIDQTGQIFHEGKKIEMTALREHLEKIIKEKGPVNLVLQADKETHHGIVVETMDIAKNAGVQSVIIAARWKADKIY